MYRNRKYSYKNYLNNQKEEKIIVIIEYNNCKEF